MNTERFYTGAVTTVIMILYFLLGLLSLYYHITGQYLIFDISFNIQLTALALVLPLLFLGGRLTYNTAPSWVSNTIMYFILFAMLVCAIFVSGE